MVETSPEDHRSYSCFWMVGRATRSLDQAARLMRALLVERPDNPHVSGYLAAIEMDRGEPESAATLFRSAADGHARRGATTAEAHVRLLFSYLLAVHQHELDEAEEQIDRARSLMDSVRDPSLPDWLALREVMLANGRLQFGRALHGLREAELRVFPDGPWILRQLWFSYMGYTMRALGRLDAAYEAYEREADLLRSVGATYEEAIPRRNLTLLAMIRGEDRETCLELAGEALAAAIRGGNRGMEALAHRDLSYLGEGDERLQHAQTALTIAREVESPGATIEGLRARAFALAETDSVAALASAEDAIELAEQLEAPSQIAIGHMTRAEILRLIGPRDQALEESLNAIDMIEAARYLQPDPEIRAAVFGAWTAPYYALASYLLDDEAVSEGGSGGESESMELAFQVMERMRARTLLDQLELARVTDPIPEQSEIIEERRRVLFEIASVQRDLLDQQLGETERRSAQGLLIQLEGEEARLREGIARTDPAFAALDQTELASLAGIQESLAEDQALILFHTADADLREETGSWVLAVSRTRVFIHDLPDTRWIRDAVALFTGLMDGDSDAADGAAVELYRQLVGSAMDDMGEGIRRVVVVPDGPLHLLPFSALRSTSAGEPLGARYALTIAPSATVWLRLREREGPELKDAALVFADPAFNAAGSSQDRSVVPGADGLGVLPYAREEGRTVLRRVGGDSRILVGDEASERAFKQFDHDSFAILHVAAHAIVDMEEHYRSGILLAAGTEGEDGLLQIRELTDLDLDGQLVVLSACRTAGGIVLSGEGVMSLARPFLLAGASAVVGSLWPLPDREAAELFDRFYSHLARGHSVAQAMSEARRDVIRSGSPARVWSGVVVLGDGDMVPLPGGAGWLFGPPWFAGLLVLIVLAGFYLLVRRARWF